MGVGKYLRELDPHVKIHPLEPSNSPTLSTGCRVGKHRIQGVSDEFIPAIVDLDFLDEVIGVDDGDAILMAQKLASELGLGVGISSGANLLGALKLVERYGPEATVVTVFPDDNKKYLSTDLLSDEPVRDGYLTPDVELLGFGSFKRVCRTCCDPADCVTAEAMEAGAIDREVPPCPLWRPDDSRQRSGIHRDRQPHAASPAQE
jgi:cysteine synthase A